MLRFPVNRKVGEGRIWAKLTTHWKVDIFARLIQERSTIILIERPEEMEESKDEESPLTPESLRRISEEAGKPETTAESPMKMVGQLVLFPLAIAGVCVSIFSSLQLARAGGAYSTGLTERRSSRRIEPEVAGGL